MSGTRYLSVAKRILLLILLYSCCRTLFLVFNYKTFAEAEGSALALSFLYGLRFDLSIIFSSNLLWIVLSILPLHVMESSNAKRLLKILFLVVNVPLLFMNLADLEYFKFTLKRTGFDVIGILGDVGSQSLQLAGYYWYIPLLIVAFIVVIVKLYEVKNSSSGKTIRPVLAWLVLPLVIAVSILIIRGGFQYKPMKPDHAFVQTPNVLGNLVLNTPYNFFSTMNFPRIENFSYYQSDEDVRKIISRPRKNFPASKKNANIVIIILESFSREYMGIGNERGYTPFLDSLARAGTFFDHHFANGKRSIEAVPSIFASIPALMDEPYITGVYQSNELHGLAEVLRKNGYHTAFFHGGRNGTMGFDKFALNAGFNSYYGLDEYPDKEKDFDGHWGIYDEPYLQYFCKQLSGFQKPFMAGIFTLSSHQPYSVPAQYKGIFPKGTLEIHESIGYADHALRNFFKTAATKDWYQNTIFIITADHTQELSTPKYRNLIGEYRVPLVIFHPGQKIEADTSQPSQHVDIMPTALDYIGVSNPHPLFFGRSLFDGTEGAALYYANYNYEYIRKDYFLEFDKINGRLYEATDWNKTKEITDRPEVKAQYEKEVKAYLQYYNNGLNKNNWYR
ncbi:MAG TPA: sulfatase-like hydrolase/transferase [Cytophagaceae bacterium]|nr:sulfatase-like hydrolase/transferase [Cytophagaceae bacterium]